MALSYRVTIMPHVSVEVDAFRYLHPFRTQTATTGSIGTGQLAAGLYTDDTPSFLEESTEWVPAPCTRQNFVGFSSSDGFTSRASANRTNSRSVTHRTWDSTLASVSRLMSQPASWSRPANSACVSPSASRRDRSVGPIMFCSVAICSEIRT